jgi:hypothetical protein
MGASFAVIVVAIFYNSPPINFINPSILTIVERRGRMVRMSDSQPERGTWVRIPAKARRGRPICEQDILKSSSG